MDNGKCSYIHAYFEDDWGRCPYPEQVKRYRLTQTNGETYINWYCDEGAKVAAEDGYSIEPCPLPDRGAES